MPSRYWKINQPNTTERGGQRQLEPNAAGLETQSEKLALQHVNGGRDRAEMNALTRARPVGRI
jgi:hypothetical protein